ncbi:MAG: SpoIID/LytB domain-containing protein [Aquificae bacterium]|nr:SpoIID/LytB domain-containing protein [Aquificota bacterium]
MARALLLLTLALLTFAGDLRETLYRLAVKYQSDGNFVTALELFTFLGNYSDAPRRRLEVYRFFLPRRFETKEEPLIRVAYASRWREVGIRCPDRTVRVSYEGGKLRAGRRTFDRLLLEVEKGCSLSADGSFLTDLPAKAKVELLTYRGRSLLVLHLPLELYLEGVLPGEVYASWPEEVLKAQAVAARTYALFNAARARAEGKPFDLTATVAHQVFVGLSRRFESVRRAVEQTRGLVLTYGGGLIYAMYHSNAGGCTNSFEDLFGLPLPYLPSVKEPCEVERLRWGRWERKLSAERLKRLLSELGTEGRVLDLSVERGVCGRGRKLVFFLEGGRRLELPLTFFARLKLKIPSDWFYPKGGLRLEGRGFGHGLGMSQWGAYCLAKKGWSFDRILKLYYGPAELKKLY